MSARVLRTSVGMAVWVIGLTLLIYILNVGQIRQIEGAQMIREVSLCDISACTRISPQELPYFSPMRFEAQVEAQALRVTLDQPTLPDDMQALYIPKLADNLDVRINGHLVFANTLPRRLWNTPLLIPVPAALVQSKAVQVDITLFGPLAEGLDLHPFFYGPLDVLEAHHAWRFFFGIGLARFALGLMVVLAAALLVVWGFRRQEREYLWLGLACATVNLTLIHYAHGISFGDYRLWTLLWVMEVSLYVLLILKFLRRFLGFTPRWPENAHIVLACAACMIILISPPGYTFLLSLWANVLITVPSAFTVLVILWLNRTLLAGADFRVFFACLSIAVVLGVYALYLFLSSAPARSMHLFHLMPLVMSLACIWLILSRLIQSIGGYETLTASLNETISEKSAELEASFAELANIKRREAIAEERDRIMLDLHDGIGGQLVSALAYMQSNNVGDDKVRLALEDALRDLALMLDSMENHDSLVTLLGMMRTRLEGQLSQHGIEFDWQVHGEPALPHPGPSQSLHLARIVQEAITNVIKHSTADTITIFVDENEIRVSDNGQGFDLAEQASREHPSNGIANMKRRSASIGAKFSVRSDEQGTRISLFFA